MHRLCRSAHRCILRLTRSSLEPQRIDTRCSCTCWWCKQYRHRSRHLRCSSLQAPRLGTCWRYCRYRACIRRRRRIQSRRRNNPAEGCLCTFPRRMYRPYKRCRRRIQRSLSNSWVRGSFGTDRPEVLPRNRSECMRFHRRSLPRFHSSQAGVDARTGHRCSRRLCM
jgi:hypothetical protein